MTEIVEKPFDWNDNLSEIALEDFDELGCKPPKDVHISLPYYARVLSCECVNDSGEGEREINMADDIFEDLTDEKRNNLWMYMIFNKDKIIEKTEEWAKKAEEIGMTLTEYLESISPLNNKEPYEDKSESEDNK